MRRTRTTVGLTVLTGLTFAFAPMAATSDATSPFVAATQFEPESAQRDCSQLTGPDSTSLGHLTGDADVDLHIRVVLDVVEGRALDAMLDDPETAIDERQAAIDAFGQQATDDYLAAGVQSYETVDITLDYGSFDLLETADLRAGDRSGQLDGQVAIDTAKAQYGGVRPAGTDIVYVLSDRDLTLASIGSALAGLADCIGGVAYDDTAFATGELQRDRDWDIAGPVALDKEFTAKVAAHEIGHLMGAHHHYQACGHYAVLSLAAGTGVGACSLMTNVVNFTTFPFSPTNEIVVRGHAENYATSNDPATR